MTLKYESEILFDLMKRDGDDAPSDVLPYESELKEKYLKQVEGAYPKLQDYRSEWLNYNLNSRLPADFPVETISNVTEATVENVVPYAYKSAILKGNSEVVAGKNKCNMEKIESGWIDGTNGVVGGNEGVYIPVEVSGTITISNYIHTAIRYVYEYDANGKYLGRTQVTTDIVTLVLTQNTTLIKIGFYKGTLSTVKSLELQVEQGEIATEYEPYNPTLVSVKMPVLTTVGKNLFDKTIKPVYVGGNGVVTYPNGNYGFEWQVVKPNTSYVLSYNVDNNSYKRNEISYYTKDKVYIKTEAKTTGLFTTPNNAHYIVTRLTVTNEPSNIQLEEGTVATSYEPYKSNILTVNDDVTLRGIGDVKDELNLLTGEVTYMLSEKRLTSELAWEMFPSWQTDELMTFGVTDINWGVGLVCNRFIKGDSSSVMGTTDRAKRSFYAHATGWFICLYKNELSEVSVQGFKEWLDNNETNIVYKLPQQSVKTVDLSVIDQDGKTLNQIKPLEGTMHLSTSGENIRPLFSGEIPVEAITQNLASFIDLEVEE